ncbi:SusC/RagA family TonB-linked outer membrane protein [Terrimonas sp.]|uniref:SusC/RagA family TonB-linked outer membrane protein n=1 Tax=Terrimonas sp. TaxID=1914338 RepID=UPI000D519890|nr:SusC/RagA family TonB-linked outer membrane protein [Terrimonas sp.]PVD49999.1 SusC/RagA family TonB-linked outer membrane protein [Terrimonas sp.]
MKILKYCLWIPFLYTFSTFAQPSPGRDITGKVMNERGEPLANANVSIKNGRGTVTNARGQFALKNVSTNDMLQISFVGYGSQTVAVKDQVVFNIVLKPAENELDRVVVQGYGTTSDRLRTGSIVKVTSEQIAKQPVMNVLNVLQGQTPGAVVTNASGYASGTVKIEIRGRNTINSNFPSEPLYVIDGVPLTILDVAGTDNYNNGSQGMIRSGIESPAKGQSPLFSINPNDVESIEVLKDADATAIYGSRASNGVILITTKSGKPGKTNFDFNFYQGIQKITNRYEMLNTQQYIQMRKEALANDGIDITNSSAPDLVEWDTTKYTDWQKYLFGNVGNTTDFQGTLTGGNAQTTFRVGASYRTQSDILALSGANKRGTLSFSFNQRSLNQKFKLSLTALYSNTYVDIISSPGNPLIAPNAPDVYDTNGKLNYSGWGRLQGYYPFAQLLQPYRANTNLLNSSMNISYEIIKGLLLKTDVGYGNSQNDQRRFRTIASQNPRFNPKGQADFGYSLFHNLIIEPQLEYNTFIKSGRITVLTGGSWQKNETNGIIQGGAEYMNDVLLSSVNNAPIQYTSSYNGAYKYAALFGRLNYNLDNKYIVNVNLRRDGSSRFGPGRQYGNFGSVGAAWIFSEERIIKKNLKFLNFGKLRASYGLTGGDQIGDYAYLTQWSFQGNSRYNSINPIVPIQHTDSTLQWQVNKKLEISLALGFFNDRITIEANWYRHRCNNQLVNFPLPPYTGFSEVVSNSPANVQNTGIELMVNAKIISTNDFNWSLKFNISQNRNKLLSYPNFSQSPYVNQFTIGKSLNIIKRLHYIGVDPQTGYYQFEDLNKDGEIKIDLSGKTADDRYDLDRSVKFDGGLNNALAYKRWELNFLFYFRKQIGANAFASYNTPGSISNISQEVFYNHWQKPGDIAKYAKFTTDGSSDPSYQNFYTYSDGIYTDASYIRLKNLSLSYTLPEAVNKKAMMKACRLFIQGENLFIITRYKGADPAVQVFGDMPIPKIITAGVSFTF